MAVSVARGTTFDSRVFAPYVKIAPPARTDALNSVVSFFAPYYIAGGTSPVWGATNIPAGLTINSASGLVSGTPSGAGENSATITATTGQGSVSVTFSWNISELLTWLVDSFPSPMNVPVGGYFDLEPFIFDSSGGATVSLDVGDSLPPGMSIVQVPTRRIVNTSAAVNDQRANVNFVLTPSYEASWIARSTAAGVFYAHNFTYKDAGKTQLIANVADLVTSAFQVGNQSRLAWDTSLKLSGGGCLRLNMPGGSYNDTGWTCSWDGIAAKTKNTSKSQFYLQWAYYADSVQNDFYYGGTNFYGGKIAIIEAPDTSFDSGEVVVRRWVEPGGFVGSYSLPVNQGYYNQVSALSRGLLNNLYDANHYGGSFPSPTTQQQWKQRHGYLGSVGTVSDPDYANAPRIISNTWMVFEAYIDLVNDCVKIWMAPYGQQPKLIMGKNAGNGDLPPVGTIDGSGANPKPIYTGAQFTNYANSPQFWPSAATFVCYDEIIASDNPISFPGNYTLPFPGTDPVTGWPWPGTVFRG